VLAQSGILSSNPGNESVDDRIARDAAALDSFARLALDTGHPDSALAYSQVLESSGAQEEAARVKDAAQHAPIAP
jgi:hypothetical protein